jgi:1,4-dihydroxy-2-naphthoate octaprenyltransferase
MGPSDSGSGWERALPARFPYGPLLAFLRTRLFGAVMMPAFIGAAYAARHGRVRAVPLALVLAGLAAAELINLFGTDYAQWRTRTHGAPAQGGGAITSDGRSTRGAGSRRGSRSGADTGTVSLPGNPVVAPSRLEPRRIPAVLLPLALLGLAIVLYFAIAVGPAVLVFFAAAVAVGGLYVFCPFPYAFLSTVVLPPLIAGGTLLALTGATGVGGFAAGLPVAWVSVAVILGYRVLYVPDDDPPEGLPARPRRRRRQAVVLTFYVLAGANVAAWVPLRLLPPAGLLALVPWGGCFAWVAALLLRERRDPVPATAAGVLMHSLTSAALALALWLG